jgi:hypothetical protein
MVTIYRSVDATATVTPVKKNAELNNHSSIRGVEGDAVTAPLDVTAAGDRLPGAQAALESGDWNSADSILAGIENSVTTAETTGPMPVRMARRNLELAKMLVQEGKYHDAAMPLKSAAQALLRLREERRRTAGRSNRGRASGHGAVLHARFQGARGRPAPHRFLARLDERMVEGGAPR